MFTLKADNRTLTNGAKFTYLKTSYTSGVSTLVVDNSTPLADLDYVLIGEWGDEFSEIVRITTVTSSSHTLSMAANTKFAHPESTRVTVVKYNQVKFYRTTTTTFSEAGTELSGSPINIQPERFHTVYNDTTNSTGYGWFKFYNSGLGVATTNSNAIPYAGFARNSVKKMIDKFMSTLNNKEMKLITMDDAFDWLNEAYIKARTHLNLSNQEYGVDTSYTLSITSGTAEYELPTGFSKLIQVTDSNGYAVGYVSLRDAPVYGKVTGNTTKYYIRGNYIGLSPTPSASATYYLSKISLPTELTSLYDNIEFPNFNYYALLNFMMFKAKTKTRDQAEAARFLQLWTDDLNFMKVNSIVQSANQDTWSISDESNV